MIKIPTYIATSFANKAGFIALKDKLEKLGCEITHDWSKDDASNVPECEREEYLHKCAVASLDGVENCELFILLCAPDMAGAYVEFGVAAAMGKSCIIVGSQKTGIRDCIFYHIQSPALLYLADDVEQLIELMEKATKLGKLISDELSKEDGTKETILGNN